MVFDFKNLIAENAINTNNVLVNSSIEESYFTDTLYFLTESTRELNSFKKELYINILESGEDYEIITESFADFFAKAKEIITRFLKYIKSLFDRFITSLHRFVNSEKHLLKNKDVLKKFDTRHEFDYEGYEFTFNDNVPSVEAAAAFNKDFVMLDFEDILKEKDPEKVVKMINAQHSALKQDLQNDRYDVFRQEVIGADRPIQSEDFVQELSAVYRNGAYDRDQITIDKTEVLKSLSRIENYKSFESSVKKTKDKIEREYEKVKKSIDNMVARNKDNDINKLLSIEIRGNYDGYSSPVQVSSEALAKIDLFLKTKVSEVLELSNIHVLAFSYKLDAINECYKQDKQILYRALNKIQKDVKGDI